MIVCVLVSILFVIADCDQERGYDGNYVEQNLQVCQLFRQDGVCKDHCENWCQLLNNANHRQTEECHRVVADKLREDSLEDAEGQG